MSSRLANEWIADLNDEVFWNVRGSQNTFDELSLTSRYPELNPGQMNRDSDDPFQMLFTLYVATIMPPEIRTLSTVVPNEDDHRFNPLRVLNSSQPSLQGLTDIRTCVIAFVCIALFTNTTLYLSELGTSDASLGWCARAEPRHLCCVGQGPRDTQSLLQRERLR